MCYDLHEGGWACHERLAIRVRIYVPMSVDTYVLDADDLAVFRAQTSAATVTDDTSLHLVRLPCTPLQGAPLRPRAALFTAAAHLVLRLAEKRERVLFIERHRRGHLQFQARGSR